MSNIFDLFKQISSGADASSGAVEYILVGLGNTGREYEKTRHNAGFMAIDYIAGRCGARIDRAKFSALVGEADINGKRVLLMKPQTYMNSSGEAVSAAAKFYKIAPENIIVISDDVSLDVGRVMGDVVLGNLIGVATGLLEGLQLLTADDLLLGQRVVLHICHDDISFLDRDRIT